MTDQTASPRQLLLVRHAKSSWKQTDLDDIDRPLNGRGRRDAPAMGARLAARPLVPALIVSSPAARAMATAQAIATATGCAEAIRVEDQLYGGSPDDVLDVVCRIEDDVRIAAVVFHNPAITDLANMYTEHSIENVPTCGIVTLQLLSDHWHQVRDGLQFIDFDYPKKR